MDESTAARREKLNRLLHEFAQAAVDLDRANGTITGEPHHSVIEAHAHDLGGQLSRQIQANQMTALADQAIDLARMSLLRDAVPGHAGETTAHLDRWPHDP